MQLSGSWFSAKSLILSILETVLLLDSWWFLTFSVNISTCFYSALRLISVLLIEGSKSLFCCGVGILFNWNCPSIVVANATTSLSLLLICNYQHAFPTFAFGCHVSSFPIFLANHASDIKKTDESYTSVEFCIESVCIPFWKYCT